MFTTFTENVNLKYFRANVLTEFNPTRMAFPNFVELYENSDNIKIANTKDQKSSKFHLDTIAKFIYHRLLPYSISAIENVNVFDRIIETLHLSNQPNARKICNEIQTTTDFHTLVRSILELIKLLCDFLDGGSANTIPLKILLDKFVKQDMENNLTVTLMKKLLAHIDGKRINSERVYYVCDLYVKYQVIKILQYRADRTVADQLHNDLEMRGGQDEKELDATQNELNAAQNELILADIKKTLLIHGSEIVKKRPLRPVVWKLLCGILFIIIIILIHEGIARRSGRADVQQIKNTPKYPAPTLWSALDKNNAIDFARKEIQSQRMDPGFGHEAENISKHQVLAIEQLSSSKNIDQPTQKIKTANRVEKVPYYYLDPKRYRAGRNSKVTFKSSIYFGKRMPLSRSHLVDMASSLAKYPGIEIYLNRANIEQYSEYEAFVIETLSKSHFTMERLLMLHTFFCRNSLDNYADLTIPKNADLTVSDRAAKQKILSKFKKLYMVIYYWTKNNYEANKDNPKYIKSPMTRNFYPDADTEQSLWLTLDKNNTNNFTHKKIMNHSNDGAKNKSEHKVLSTEQWKTYYLDVDKFYENIKQRESNVFRRDYGEYVPLDDSVLDDVVFELAQLPGISEYSNYEKNTTRQYSEYATFTAKVLAQTLFTRPHIYMLKSFIMFGQIDDELTFDSHNFNFALFRIPENANMSDDTRKQSQVIVDIFKRFYMTIYFWAKNSYETNKYDHTYKTGRVRYIFRPSDDVERSFPVSKSESTVSTTGNKKEPYLFLDPEKFIQVSRQKYTDEDDYGKYIPRYGREYIGMAFDLSICNGIKNYMHYNSRQYIEYEAFVVKYLATTNFSSGHIWMLHDFLQNKGMYIESSTFLIPKDANLTNYDREQRQMIADVFQVLFMTVYNFSKENYEKNKHDPEFWTYYKERDIDPPAKIMRDGFVDQIYTVFSE